MRGYFRSNDSGRGVEIESKLEEKELPKEKDRAVVVISILTAYKDGGGAWMSPTQARRVADMLKRAALDAEAQLHKAKGGKAKRKK
jgi:hypothetical protein